LKFSSFRLGIAWLALLTVLLCLPGSTIPMHPFLRTVYADKWVHAFLFFALVTLFSLPFRNEPKEKRRKWLPLILLLGICYGVMTEFMQKYWVINREFEIGDILADATGCLVAGIIGWKKIV
jgi:VanZ family protein